MKYRFWTRIAAASLMLLGDGAFASETSSRNEGETGVNSDSIQISHSVVQENAGAESTHSLTCDKTSHPVARITRITFPVTTISFSNSTKYKSFIPRAPPAST